MSNILGLVGLCRHYSTIWPLNGKTSITMSVWDSDSEVFVFFQLWVSSGRKHNSSAPWYDEGGWLFWMLVYQGINLTQSSKTWSKLQAYVVLIKPMQEFVFTCNNLEPWCLVVPVAVVVLLYQNHFNIDTETVYKTSQSCFASVSIILWRLFSTCSVSSNWMLQRGRRHVLGDQRSAKISVDSALAIP